MATLVSTMVSFTGVQNEQTTTLKTFAKIIAEVHHFKTQCSSNIIALMKELNAFQATIKSLTDRITVLETAPSSAPPSSQDTSAGLSDQILARTARIKVLETAPAPSPRVPLHHRPPSSKGNWWSPATQPPPTTITNDTILASVNKALKTTSVRFILARRSLKGNLVLLTAPANKASEAIDHGDAIASCLKNLGCTPTLMRSNATWTSFLVHNIPTSTTAEEVATAIQLNCPSLTICRHPRWLPIEDKQKEKTHSSMGITLPRQLTLANLGLTSLAISNWPLKPPSLEEQRYQPQTSQPPAPSPKESGEPLISGDIPTGAPETNEDMEEFAKVDGEKENFIRTSVQTSTNTRTTLKGHNPRPTTCFG
ncbi:hypothetical protein Q9L58_010365 [Maublancomyces gigas]|uniref:Uncharacterized protein n=1 Tax=Discina gigas TaxID=1032678 RepID=A0ABR3G4Q3_9PEZI